MKYYIGESGSSGRTFDSLEEFLEAIADMATASENVGFEWFEIEVAAE